MQFVTTGAAERGERTENGKQGWEEGEDGEIKVYEQQRT